MCRRLAGDRHQGRRATACHGVTRRQFIRAGRPRWAWGQEPDEEIPRRELGKTGVKLAIIGLGGHHIGRIRNGGESVRLIRTAVDMGINSLDNAWEYHRGRSE